MMARLTMTCVVGLAMLPMIFATEEAAKALRGADEVRLVAFATAVSFSSCARSLLNSFLLRYFSSYRRDLDNEKMLRMILQRLVHNHVWVHFGRCVPPIDTANGVEKREVLLFAVGGRYL